jgi:hypothetical protein
MFLLENTLVLLLLNITSSRENFPFNLGLGSAIAFSILIPLRFLRKHEKQLSAKIFPLVELKRTPPSPQHQITAALLNRNSAYFLLNNLSRCG